MTRSFEKGVSLATPCHVQLPYAGKCVPFFLRITTFFASKKRACLISDSDQLYRSLVLVIFL